MYLCVRWGLWNAHANRGNPITCRQDLQLFLHSILCSVVTNIEENFIFFCSPTTWPRFALNSDFQYLWQLSRVANMTATIWNILEMIDIVLSHFDLLHAVEAQNSFWSEFLLRVTQRRSRVQFDLLWQFSIVLCVTVHSAAHHPPIQSTVGWRESRAEKLVVVTRKNDFK